MSSRQLGYSVERFKDPGAEVVRLERQADFVAEVEEQLLEALGLPAAGRLLDIGCGPGAVAARIRQLRPRLDIVGLDRDAGLLALARARLTPLRADAAVLPFASRSFDAVHARLLLRHLPDPGAALAEMRRVLRPGGRLIITDSDDVSLVLHPLPRELARALAAKHQTARRRGADPEIGRRLVELVSAAGFSALTTRAQVIDSGAVGRSTFAPVVLAPIAGAVDSDLLPAVEQQATVAAVRRWAEDVTAFGMTTVVRVGGTRD